jgi:hypothetical protein
VEPFKVMVLKEVHVMELFYMDDGCMNGYIGRMIFFQCCLEA